MIFLTGDETCCGGRWTGDGSYAAATGTTNSRQRQIDGGWQGTERRLGPFPSCSRRAPNPQGRRSVLASGLNGSREFPHSPAAPARPPSPSATQLVAEERNRPPYGAARVASCVWVFLNSVACPWVAQESCATRLQRWPETVAAHPECTTLAKGFSVHVGNGPD